MPSQMSITRDIRTISTTFAHLARSFGSRIGRDPMLSGRRRLVITPGPYGRRHVAGGLGVKRLVVPIVVAGGLVGVAPAMPPNQPPTACFTVDPASGTVATSFAVDASCSTDDRTQPSKLKVRWDWESDGVWDTPLTTTKTASLAFQTEGAPVIRLEVVDVQGLADLESHAVVVQPTFGESLVGEPLQAPGATEPDVDVNPTDPQNIVVSALTGNFGGSGLLPFPSFFSADGGQTWARSMGSPGVRTLDPGMEFDTLGNAFLSTIDDQESDGTPQGLVVSRSQDGGATYMFHGRAVDPSLQVTFPGGVVRNPCSAYPVLILDYPKLAADKGAASPYRDSLYALAFAVTFDGNGDGICGDLRAPVFALSRDAGATWESGQALDLGGKLTSSIGVGADGAVDIVDGVTSAAICPSGSGVSFRKSVDGGASFGSSSCIYDSDGSIQPQRTWTAASPSDAGAVYVAFDAIVPALGGSQHVFLMRSANGGADWSAPIRVDDVVGNDVVDHHRPTLSVSATGRLDVVWFDYRHSTPTTLVEQGQPGDAYYACSLDGGTTWLPSLRLSPATAPFLRSAQNDFLTAISTGDLARVVYSQDRDVDGRYEAYLATITFH